MVREMLKSPDLPEGWIHVEFKDVIEVNPRKSVDLNPDDFVTFVPMAAVSEVTGTIAEPQQRHLREVNKGFTHFVNNDVLFAKITPSMENGKSAVATNLESGVGFGSTEFHVLRSKGKVLPAYIWNFIRQSSFRTEAQKVMSGAVGQQRVPSDYLKTHKLPLPPLEEQARICKKISDLLARTEKSRQELSRVPALITKLKSQLLHNALSGNLTAKWRKEGFNGGWSDEDITRLKSRREKYQKSKKGARLKDANSIERARNGRLPESWVTCSISDVADLRTGYAFKSQWFSDTGVSIVRGVNVAPGRIDWNDRRKIPEVLAKEYQSYSLTQGDIVLAMDRPLISTGLKIAVVGEEDEGALLVQRVANPRPTEFVMSRFLFLIMCGPTFIAQIQANSTGSDLPHISGNDILTTEIVLPPLIEQAEIIRRYDEISHWINLTQVNYQAAVTLIPDLNSSILKKAFLGELLPQNPADEPAGSMMSRVVPIKAASSAPRAQMPKKQDSQVTNDPKISLIQDSATWPENGLPFEQLAKRHSFKNDVMRDALFALMTGESPKLKQVFDVNTECMHIMLVKK